MSRNALGLRRGQRNPAWRLRRLPYTHAPRGPALGVARSSVARLVRHRDNVRMSNSKRVGVMYDRGLPPEGLAEFARTVEAAGADELWVVEDLGYAGSVSAATAALAATSRIAVGIGVVPAPFRNPALLAMELAAVASMFPQRLIAGFDDHHLDFRVVVDIALADAGQDVTTTTLVRTHNRLGRAYLAFIAPFHRMVTKAMLAQVCRGPAR